MTTSNELKVKRNLFIFVYILALVVLLTSCGGPDSPYVEVAGIARMSQSTHEWHLLQSGGHQTLNVTEIDWQERETIDEQAVGIYWGFNATEIIFCSVNVDETYARFGVIAGPKVDADRMIIQFNKTFDELDDVNGNIFFRCLLKK